MAPRRLLPLLFVALSTGLVLVARAIAPTQVAAGGDLAAASSTTEAAATSSTSTSTASPETTTTSASAPPATTSTTAPPAGDAAASPVDGLDAAQLQQAVEAPGSGTARSAAGATVDQVMLDDGTHVWRVRVPGAFQARSARVAVSVGSRVVGEGVLATDLHSITAVTTDGTGLTAGQPVSYQWEGGPTLAAGNLAVVR